MKMLLLQLSTVSKCLAMLQHYPHGKDSSKGKQLFTVWFNHKDNTQCLIEDKLYFQVTQTEFEHHRPFE